MGLKLVLTATEAAWLEALLSVRIAFCRQRIKALQEAPEGKRNLSGVNLIKLWLAEQASASHLMHLVQRKERGK